MNNYRRNIVDDASVYSEATEAFMPERTVSYQPQPPPPTFPPSTTDETVERHHPPTNNNNMNMDMNGTRAMLYSQLFSLSEQLDNLTRSAAASSSSNITIADLDFIQNDLNKMQAQLNVLRAVATYRALCVANPNPTTPTAPTVTTTTNDDTVSGTATRITNNNNLANLLSNNRQIINNNNRREVMTTTRPNYTPTFEEDNRVVRIIPHVTTNNNIVNNTTAVTTNTNHTSTMRHMNRNHMRNHNIDTTSMENVARVIQKDSNFLTNTTNNTKNSFSDTTSFFVPPAASNSMQNNVTRVITEDSSNFITNNTNNSFSTAAVRTEKPTNNKNTSTTLKRVTTSTTSRATEDEAVGKVIKQQQKKKKSKSAMKTNAKTKTKKKDKKYVCRNRSAYNFFYKHQRYVIIEELRKTSTSAKTNKNEEEQTSQQFQTVQEIEAFLLNVDTVAKSDRRHVKTHGLIGLQELTRLIARRWKECDEETKDIYKQLAIRDHLRYKYQNNYQEKCEEEKCEEGEGGGGDENTSYPSIGENA